MAGFDDEHPKTGNRAIDSCGFGLADTARLVETLWFSAGQSIAEDVFIKSLPFLFRMYQINEPYWTE